MSKQTPKAAGNTGTQPAARPKLVLKSRGAKADVVYELPFGKKNFIHLFIGIAILLIGYGMMSSREFVDATEFSFALYVAPFVVLAGYVYIVYAILLKDKGTPPSGNAQ